MNTDFDLLIVGDEVESIITAVSAWRASRETEQGFRLRIGLLRHNAPKTQQEGNWLGGLSTRGGLSYMDITPEYIPPLFGEFLTQANVTRVALCPHKAHQALSNLLSKTDITVLEGSVASVHKTPNSIWELSLSAPSEPSALPLKNTLTTHQLIDSTPDADIARLAGVDYTKGLGHFMDSRHSSRPTPLDGSDASDNSNNKTTSTALESFPNTLGVSAVFTLHGLLRHDLIHIEQTLRQRPESKSLLQQALPYKTHDEIEELLNRPVFSPDEMDYVDILNPLIGIHFHVWQGHSATSYLDAPVHIDGFNTSRLPEHNPSLKKDFPECFGMNGVVMHLPDIQAQHRLSQGKSQIPEPLTQTIQTFQAFLLEHGAPSTTSISMPQQAYVRQTFNIHSQRRVSVASLFSGGVPAEQAVGTFSYWIDLRGIQWREFFPDTQELPKPVFNVGLSPCFPRRTTSHHSSKNEFDHLAVLSRSAGYGPLAQGPCRIIQHQAMLGEALGIAAVFAHKHKTPLHQVNVSSIQSVLNKRYQTHQNRDIPIEGHCTFSPEDCNKHPLVRQESRFLARASESCFS